MTSPRDTYLHPQSFSDLFPCEYYWAQGPGRGKRLGKHPNACCLGIRIHDLRIDVTPAVKALGFSGVMDLFKWNDDPDRKFSEVQEACRRLDEEFPHAFQPNYAT